MLYRFIVWNCFHIPLYIIPHCIPVINIVKKIPTNSAGMNLLFSDFLTAKFCLKIFGEYLKKLLKVLPISKFLYRFAKNAKNWMPSKKARKHFLKFRFWTKLLVGQSFSQTQFLVGHNFSHLLKIPKIVGFAEETNILFEVKKTRK